MTWVQLEIPFLLADKLHSVNRIKHNIIIQARVVYTVVAIQMKCFSSDNI